MAVLLELRPQLPGFVGQLAEPCMDFLFQYRLFHKNCRRRLHAGPTGAP
jgi:hypothetical protein